MHILRKMRQSLSTEQYPARSRKAGMGKELYHCMACICRCPAEAIEYGKHGKGMPRYVCPKTMWRHSLPLTYCLIILTKGLHAKHYGAYSIRAADDGLSVFPVPRLYVPPAATLVTLW